MSIGSNQFVHPGYKVKTIILMEEEEKTSESENIFLSAELSTVSYLCTWIVAHLPSGVVGDVSAALPLLAQLLALPQAGDPGRLLQEADSRLLSYLAWFSRRPFWGLVQS